MTPSTKGTTGAVTSGNATNSHAGSGAITNRNALKRGNKPDQENMMGMKRSASCDTATAATGGFAKLPPLRNGN